MITFANLKVSGSSNVSSSVLGINTRNNKEEISHLKCKQNMVDVVTGHFTSFVAKL